MADRSKFEEMLELLVNEDREAAQELFHEIVVEKSRDIYESLLENDEEDDLDESDDDDLDESDDDADESDEDLDEDFDLDEFEVEADDDEIGGDPADDMMMDLEPEDDDDMDMDMDMDDDEDGDTEDRIEDLEDALDELKAEFEKMMSGDDSDDDADMDMDVDMDSDDGEMDMDLDSDDDEDDEEDKKESLSASEQMREYVEKVGGDRYDSFGKMGDNGVQTKSTVASKNDMGGTTQNILRGDSEKGVEANKGKIQGSALNDQTPKDMKTKNINVPGGKAGKAMSAMSKGHGAEKRGSGETADKGASSPINGVKTRAK